MALLNILPKVEIGIGDQIIIIFVAVICMLSTLMYIYACFVHRCLMSWVLVALACVWLVFNIMLFIAAFVESAVLLDIWIYVTMIYTDVVIVLLIVYAAHCCCCCIEPAGCGIAILVVGIVFYTIVQLLMLFVNTVRVHRSPGGLGTDAPGDRNPGGLGTDAPGDRNPGGLGTDAPGDRNPSFPVIDDESTTPITQ